MGAKTYRLALWLWYRGGAFRGYQAQPQGPTVQGELQAALRKLGIPSAPIPSGRTDLGVHARKQVVMVRLPLGEGADAFVARLGAGLGPDLGIAAAAVASPSFHPQWGAEGKQYRYRLRLSDGAASWAPYAWRVDVDRGALREALALYPGTREFKAFHEASSPVRERTLTEATLVEAEDGLCEVRFSGDGFGRYMVRYLCGTAVAVAQGALSADEVRDALATGVSIRGVKAPAEGLILWDVRYPESIDPFAASAGSPSLPDGPPFVTFD